MQWLKSVLEKPFLYNLIQNLLYREGQQEKYVREWVKPRPGDHILDIGCGTARILGLMPGVHYLGYDPNPKYIAAAVECFGKLGDFRCAPLKCIRPEELGRFDIVMANGVLHHLSDDETLSMVRLAWEALKPGGKMVTRDGCIEKDQLWLVRFLLQNDRETYVRTQPGYESLLRQRFDELRSMVVRDALRLPYSLIHIEATKGAPG